MDRTDLQDHLDQQRQVDEHAAEQIAAMASAVDIDSPEFPCETRDVLRLAQAFGYRIDGDYLFGLLEAGTPPVARVGGRRRFLPADVFHLLMILESRRRWTLHRFHLHKLSSVERMQLEAEAAGKEHAFEDLDSYDVEQLLLLMEGCEVSHVRHTIRLALTAKLRESGML